MPNEPRNAFRIRLIIASVMALLVLWICLNVTYNEVSLPLDNDATVNREFVVQTDIDVKIYRRKKGKLPQSLAQLKTVVGEPSVDCGCGEHPDGWQQPLRYEVHGNDYLIESYGRDGKPGGVGLDCDISQKNPRPPEAALPLLQVLEHPEARELVQVSLISGALAFLFTFAQVKPAALKGQWRGALVAQLYFTLLATLFVAIMIVELHAAGG